MGREAPAVILDAMLLIYAFRPDAVDHVRHRMWLEQLANSGAPFSVPDAAFAALFRIATNPSIYNPPSSMVHVVTFANGLRAERGFVPIAPGTKHWGIFTGLCQQPGIRFNDIPDAYIAALAIEHGQTLMTTDKGFRRFRGLDFRHPLEP